MSRDSVFSYKIVTEGEWERILFGGPVTEDAKARLQQLCTEAGPKCILDLRAITYVNSCGIRDWSYALKELKVNRDLVFEFVPDDVVRTMNMIMSFRQGLPVRSVIRAYECDTCDHETSVVLTEGRDFKAKNVPKIAAVKCDSCGSQAKPLESDEAFFLFLMTAA